MATKKKKKHSTKKERPTHPLKGEKEKKPAHIHRIGRRKALSLPTKKRGIIKKKKKKRKKRRGAVSSPFSWKGERNGSFHWGGGAVQKRGGEGLQYFFLRGEEDINILVKRGSATKR